MTIRERRVRTDFDFEAMMLEVDEQLRKEGVPIPARELRSLALVCQAVGLEELRVFPGYVFKKESFSPVDLTGHIFAWFRARYGDRLKMDFSPGSRLIGLRGNLWLMRLPRVYGRARFMAEKNLSRQYDSLVTPKNRAQNPNGVMVNVLQSIQDLPQGLASTLTTEETNQIVLDFIQAWRTFNALEVFPDHPLAKGASADITQSARYGVAGPESFGQSRWSSLQGAEKALKLFLSLKGQSFPKTHRLEQLAELCKGLGLKTIDPSVIANAQCSADTRYEYTDKDPKPIAEANSAAMKIAYIATTNAPGGKPQPVPKLMTWPAT